jgi:serine/threonine-protein kinase RIO1
VIANPQGRTFLDRDATVVATWFSAHGLPCADPRQFTALLRAEARLR